MKKGRLHRPFFFAPALLILALAWSCKTKAPNQIEFGYGHHFKIIPGEKQAGIDKAVVADYEKYLNHFPQINIPLTRLVEAKRYGVYIGICVDAPLPALKKALALDTTAKLIRSGSNWSLVRNQDRFLVRLTHDNGQYPPYCITVMSSDSLLADSVAGGSNPLFTRFSFYEKK